VLADESEEDNCTIDGPDIHTLNSALYDRYMGPLLFEPYAKLVAERCALLQPDSILATAAGTTRSGRF
jgi:hypothetical protein